MSLASNATAIEAVDRRTGRIVGMIGYECWTPNSVQTHMAVETPIAWRSLLRPTFSYPFEEVGVGVMLAIVPAHNARSIALVRRFGLHETHRIRDGWRVGVDLVVFELRKHECRFIGNNEVN